MKVPVLMALGRQVDAGSLSWDDSVAVVNRFASIVDGSPYQLTAAEDGDSTLYGNEGCKRTLRRG